MCAMNTPPHYAHNAEAKVIFLGDPGVGKSLILSGILREDRDSSDSALTIKSWLCDTGTRTVLTNFWNFGMTAIQYDMYRLFLPAHAVYVAVLDARSDLMDQAHRWLHAIRLAAPEAPVLLVVNNADSEAGDLLDVAGLRARYPGNTDIVRITAAEAKGPECSPALMEALKTQLNAVAALHQPVQREILALNRALDASRKDYLTWSDYEKLCNTCGIKRDQDFRRSLLPQISDTGTWYSFMASNMQSARLLCHPQWILRALETLLRSDLGTRGTGLVDETALYEVLEKPGTVLPRFLTSFAASDRANRAHFLIAILFEFRLLHPLNAGTFFLPMFCGRNSPAIVQEYIYNDRVREFHLEFEYLPIFAIHRLIVSMADYLDPLNVWYFGARFVRKVQSDSALVEKRGNTLIIRIRSDSLVHVNSFLVRIRQVLALVSQVLHLRPLDLRLAYRHDGLLDLFSLDVEQENLPDPQQRVYSPVFDRLLSFAEMLGDPDYQQDAEIQKLLRHVAQACMEVHNGSPHLTETEDACNTILRQSLWANQYLIADHRILNLPSRSGRSPGEVDLLLMDRDRKPWTMIEAMNVRNTGKNSLNHWDEHLNLLLQQHSSLSTGLPAVFLVTYVRCSLGQYYRMWHTFREHIRWYEPDRTKLQEDSFSDIVLEDGLPSALRIAKCAYTLRGHTVTVYHYFVHLDEPEEPEDDQRGHLPVEFVIDSSGSMIPPVPPRDTTLEHRTTLQDQQHRLDELMDYLDRETEQALNVFPDDFPPAEDDIVDEPAQPAAPGLPREEIAQYEYRVVFLGDSEAGKSQLLARVMDSEKGLTEFTGQTTPGICLEHRYYDLDGHWVRVNFWDFGGQEILHSLHRMFLSDRTLYVIVLNTRNDNHDAQADFWMRYVQAYAYGAPVLFVMNKTDQNPRAKLNLPVLNRQFQQHFTESDVLYTCAIEPDPKKFEEAFTAKLIDRVAAAMDFTSGFTPQQLAIRNDLESRKTADRVIKTDTFRAICEDYGLEDEDSQVGLMERFHQAGILVFFGTDLKMLLDPQWITKAIYALLEKQDEISEGGIVSQKKLESLCRKLLGDSDHAKFILEVMRYYGLSFQYGFRNSEDPGSENQEFIPMLCRQEEPEQIDALTMADNTVEMRLHFEYLPTGILYQLMVALRKHLDPKLVWRSGARFRFGPQVSAIVRREGSLMRLYVHYDAEEAKPDALDVLEQLRSRIVAISEQGRSTAKLLETKIGYTVGTIPEFFDYQQLRRAEASRVYYVASTARNRHRIFIPDILAQEYSREEKLVRKLLEVTLECGSILQGKQTYWFRHGQAAKDPSAPKMGEDERTELFWIKLKDHFNVSEQPRWGSSASGVKSGELDLKIDTLEQDAMKRDSLAILEALNITGINETSIDRWTEHLERMINHYNASGLRHLLLVSYLDCAVDTIKDVQTAYLHLLRTHRVPNYGVPQITPDVLQHPHERIHVVQADYSGGAGDVSVYHFLIHIPRYVGQPEKKKQK